LREAGMVPPHSPDPVFEADLIEARETALVEVMHRPDAGRIAPSDDRQRTGESAGPHVRSPHEKTTAGEPLEGALSTHHALDERMGGFGVPDADEGIESIELGIARFFVHGAPIIPHARRRARTTSQRSRCSSIPRRLRWAAQAPLFMLKPSSDSWSPSGSSGL